MTKTLIVAAHPDDETLGAAGAILREVEDGRIVHVTLLGEGPMARTLTDSTAQHVQRLEAWQQARVAGRGLGVSEVHCGYMMPDNRFDAVDLLRVVQMVEDSLRQHGPFERVYTHQPHDLNIDHRLTCQAVLTATRPVPGQTVKAVYGFEVPSSTEWAFGAPPFVPNVFQPLTDDQMERKRQALRCYASELRDFPHPRSIEAVDALARYRGSQCGHPWAEAFQLLREIR